MKVLEVLIITILGVAIGSTLSVICKGGRAGTSPSSGVVFSPSAEHLRLTGKAVHHGPLSAFAASMQGVDSLDRVQDLWVAHADPGKRWALLLRAVEIDGRQFWEWLEASHAEDVSWWKDKFFQAWGVVDREAAWAWALERSDLLFSEWMERFLRDWYEEAPERAEGVAARWEVDAGGISGRAFEREAEADLMGAAEAAVAAEDATERRRRYAAVLKVWVKEDFEGAVRWLSEQDPDSLPEDTVERVVLDLRESPDLAHRLLACVPPSKDRRNSYQGVARAWAEEDPQAAMQWASLLPRGTERSLVFGTGLSALQGVETPREMLRRVDEADEWTLGSRYLASGYGRLFASLPTPLPGIKAWSTGINVETSVGSVVQESLSALAQEAPKEALGWMANLERHYGDGLFHQSFRQAYEGWLGEDLSAAQAWRAALPVTVRERWLGDENGGEVRDD